MRTVNVNLLQSDVVVVCRTKTKKKITEVGAAALDISELALYTTSDSAVTGTARC